MKNVTVNIQIQFDVFSDTDDKIKNEVIHLLSSMSQTLAKYHMDNDPLIFTNAIDSSDIQIHTPEDEEEEDEEIDASLGVETNFGHMEVLPRMLETDGTNLVEGVDVRLEGEFVGEVVGGTKYFESVDALEEWYSTHFDEFHPNYKGK